MSDTNDKGGARRLAVYAIPESTNGERPWWPKIGIAYVNRDGSISILLEALPLGTNKLQVRELRDDGRTSASAAPRRPGLETIEVRP
jgi:hypothetical protein